MRIGHTVAAVIWLLAGYAASAETYKSPQGVPYGVERVPNIVQAALPQNNDLKMADGDLAKYGESICGLDVPPATAPSRCDIYVQPDKGGTLVGYAAIIEDKNGVRFQTATETNLQMHPYDRSCWLSGKLTRSGEDYKRPVNANSDFQAQSMYSAWEKEPGNWMIAPANDDASADSRGALGVWYVSRKGDKLRITQERWSYCYPGSSVNVDDVFFRIVTLSRVRG